MARNMEAWATRRNLRLVAPLAFLLAAPGVMSQTHCSAVPFSPDEARSLLRAIPDALAAKHIGGKLSTVEWRPPGSGYRVENFFLFELLSTKSLPTTPLNNGVLGYYGVNKTTGDVVELNSDKNPIQGHALKLMQDKLRALHCVSSDLVLKNRVIPLER